MPSEYPPRRLAVHILLFLATVVTTMFAGMLWLNITDVARIGSGLPYSFALLFILTCHEFGHFFAARRHGVLTTLPYYIPLPPVITLLTFGTMGAVIRTKSPIPSRKALFDIGVAGPIAGFIASIIILAVGFMTLPGPEFLLSIHPEYNFGIDQMTPADPEGTLTFGSTLLYSLFEQIFAKPGAYVPPMTEMYHYPMLMAGWFGLLVTSYNMLPAGQLDGGHIIFAMFGKKHRIIARATVAVLIAAGLIGMLPELLVLLKQTDMAMGIFAEIPRFQAFFSPAWLIWAIFILVLVRVDHPPVQEEDVLDGNRMLLGWVSIVMLFFCITPAPIYFS